MRETSIYRGNRRQLHTPITLNEIKDAAIEDHGEIEFTLLAEAKEYRESLAIKEKEESNIRQKEEILSKFPETL